MTDILVLFLQYYGDSWAACLSLVKSSPILVTERWARSWSRCTVSQQVTWSHPPGGRLPLLFARPAVTFPAEERHRPSAGTKSYCLVTKAYACEQCVQDCYLEADQPRFEPSIFRIASERSTVKPHRPPYHWYQLLLSNSVCHGTRWRSLASEVTTLDTQNLNTYRLTIRPPRMHAGHRCGLLLQMSHVAWSVCVLSYGYALQKQLNRSRCRLRLTLVGPRNYVLDGGRDPHGNG